MGSPDKDELFAVDAVVLEMIGIVLVGNSETLDEIALVNAVIAEAETEFVMIKYDVENADL